MRRRAPELSSERSSAGRRASPPTALLHDPDSRDANRSWLAFHDPVEILVAEQRSAVPQMLDQVAEATRAGAWAVGFVTYEASPAFDPALVTHAADAMPYAWWALFDRADRVAIDTVFAQQGVDGTGLAQPTLTPPALSVAPLSWHPLVTQRAHRTALLAIKDAIARGDTYQVNLTFPLETSFERDPFALFATLIRAQRPPLGAWIDTGTIALCSASPELFFRRQGERLITRPMKGTARRGRFLAEDRAHLDRLRASTKERAENVMIVDMMRNDLGRIARPGSVTVPQLFTVETYPTVHQMTSTVVAESSASLREVFTALFPCASITGAPKVSTMGIIRTLEPHPRGIYTGTIGVVEPGGDARFSVAIRTVTVDRARRTARYGTGGGIVWDSDAEREYEECRTKALILTASRPQFDLLETLVWRPRRGFLLLDRHLERLRASAAFFGRPCDTARVIAALEQAIREHVGPDLDADRPRPGRPEAGQHGPGRWRVRLIVAPNGRPSVTAVPFPCAGRETWSVALDDRPVASDDPFLFHKTTHRPRYEQAQARRPDVDEVLLFNEHGELTESCRANLVLRFGDRFVTPPQRCGLLAGTYRAELLARGRLEERILHTSDLARADAVLLVNAVRGFVRARLIAEAATKAAKTGRSA